MSSITVQGVLRELEAQGLIQRQPRRGTIVRARIPRAGRNRQVAIISAERIAQGPGITDYAWRITHAAQEALTGDKFHPMVLQTNHAVPDPIPELLERLEDFGSMLSGVIYFHHEALVRLDEALQNWGVPWVVVNSPNQTAIHNYVAADNLMGCRLVGHCLARLGHHRTLMLMSRGTHTSQTEMEKVTGLIQGFLQTGAPLGGLEVAVSHGAPETVALEYFKRPDRPQAIFAHSDTIAFGVIRACAKLGLSIPQDVRLVSSGGMGLAAIAQPPLTALTQPAEAIGREAANMLKAMIEENTIRIERRRVPGSLVIRESCPISDDVCEELHRAYPDFGISRAM